MRALVVVTGLGLVTPLGTTAEETWNGFLEGRSGIRKIDIFDSDRYPSSRGGVVDRTALPQGTRHDPATLLVLKAAEEAIRQAGPLPERTALVLGSTLGSMPAATEYVRGGCARAGLLREMLAQTQARIVCDRFGLRGESLVISDACASGTNALGYALRLLRSGNADAVVAGGYDPMAEFSFAGFHSLQAITSKECRPFDRDRSGLLLGEGAAILVLERENGKTPLARLAGYGESADAYHITRPDPEARGAILALRRALKDAGLEPGDIDHVNAHGTGTPSNDAMEAKAIREVFGNVPLTANKAAIGHTLGGAGAIEAAVTVLSLRDQVIPPTLHHENLDEACAGIDVVSRRRDCRMQAAVSNSFGFGGSNAAVVLTTP